jgi:hypothetical protein
MKVEKGRRFQSFQGVEKNILLMEAISLEKVSLLDLCMYEWC